MGRVVDPDLGHVQVDVGALLRPHGGDVVDLEAEPLDLSQERKLVLRVGDLSIDHVRSLTQFQSVNLILSRIVVRKCVFILQTHNQGLCQLFLTVSWDLRV